MSERTRIGKRLCSAMAERERRAFETLGRNAFDLLLQSCEQWNGKTACDVLRKIHEHAKACGVIA